jgi:predicted dienelactone hydrolase
VEVWYPAPPGAARGVAPARYDLRLELPDYDRDKIPDAENPWQVCDCARDLPLDEAHGPYPVVLFIHGTGGFRTQSLGFMTHWASRGFVVLAANHPLIQLSDVLQLHFGADQPGDGLRVLGALAAGEIPFLTGRVAPERLALAGHSAGGAAVAEIAAESDARVVLPMAAGGVAAAGAAASVLVLGGLDDGIVPYARQLEGYEATSAPRRLVGLRNAGHLAFSEICAIGADQGGILDNALRNDVTVPTPVRHLAMYGCGAGQLAPERGWRVVRHATSAALEEALACSPTAAARLEAMPAALSDVAEYREALGTD